MIDKQKEIFDRIKELKDRLEDFKCEMVLLRNACEKLARERDAEEAKAEASIGVAKQLGANPEAALKEKRELEAQLANTKRFANMFARRWKSVGDERDRLRAALLGELISLHKWNGHTQENVMECPLCLESEWHSRIINALRLNTEQPAAIFTDGHYFTITPGDEIQVEYVRKDSRLGFVWGEDSSWFVAMTNGYSASGYLDGRLKMDELRAALKVFAEQPAASEVKE